MEESKTHFFLVLYATKVVYTIKSCLHNFLLLYKQIYATKIVYMTF